MKTTEYLKKVLVQKFPFVNIVNNHENNQPNINSTNKKQQMLYTRIKQIK